MTRGTSISKTGLTVLCTRPNDDAVQIAFNVTGEKFYTDTPLSLPPILKLTGANEERREACKQLFSGPRDLASIADLFVSGMTDYSSGLDREVTELVSVRP